MGRPNVGQSLYYKLPNVYREEDAKVDSQYPLPLKRVLDVYASGMDFMEEKIEGLENLYDLDKCPAEFLPLIAQTLGFDFPYALSENEQRRFIKILPYLYMTKGEPKSFEYLAREIFGTQSTIKAYKEVYEAGMTVLQWRRIYVEVQTDGEQLNLGRKEAYFRKFAELVRPVNTLLISVLTTYLSDDYDRDRLGDDYSVVSLLENSEEVYRTRSIITKLLDKNITLDSTAPDYREEDIVDRVKEEWVQNLIIEVYEDALEKHSLLDRGFTLEQSMLDSTNSGNFIDTMILDAIMEQSSDEYKVFIREYEADAISEQSEDTYTKQVAEEFSTSISFTASRSVLDSVTLLDGFYLDDIQVSMSPSY